ncbi:MAG: hypothetical protein JSV45_13995 [Chromatiales bacterium]|nr:MAG: hypothetical protein JSV45_13995 [Chromatiales bacterium]
MKEPVKSRVRITIAFVLILYALMEGLSLLGLWVLESSVNVVYDPVVEVLSETQRTRLSQFLEQGRGQRVEQDPVLGWYRIGNSAGMRDDREYEKRPAPGTIRVSAFGDSFTYGSDVELQETWAKQLTTIVPAIETLNYGNGAYGLDQAYLRYRKLGAEYNPDIVLIGFMTENIARHVNVFRAFYTRSYRNVIFTKPRFILQDGQLTLLDNPIASLEDHRDLLANDRRVLAELGRNDYHYQINYRRGRFDFLPSVRLMKIVAYVLRLKILDPIIRLDGMYSAESEAYDVTVAIFDAFYREVLENGALPIVVIFPDLHDQRRSRKKRERRYSPLLVDLEGRGYPVIDTMTALEAYESQYSIKELTRDWGHYSPVGNRIVAEYIAGELEQWGYLRLENVDRAVREEQARLGLPIRAVRR